MLGRYGVAMAAGRLVPFDEAVAAADAIGYPVAVKAHPPSAWPVGAGGRRPRSRPGRRRPPGRGRDA